MIALELVFDSIYAVFAVILWDFCSVPFRGVGAPSPKSPWNVLPLGNLTDSRLKITVDLREASGAITRAFPACAFGKRLELEDIEEEPCDFVSRPEADSEFGIVSDVK